MRSVHGFPGEGAESKEGGKTSWCENLHFQWFLCLSFLGSFSLGTVVLCCNTAKVSGKGLDFYQKTWILIAVTHLLCDLELDH